MKGVSTLVVVILLLLITISLVGFVFIFFSRSTSGAAEQTQQQQEQLQQNLGKQVRIDNAAGTRVDLRHTGTVNINKTTDVTVFVNNALQTVTWDNANTLLVAGGTGFFNLGTTCPSGAELKITTPAGSVTSTCE